VDQYVDLDLDLDLNLQLRANFGYQQGKTKLLSMVDDTIGCCTCLYNKFSP
jgi:hypothetical protein